MNENTILRTVPAAGELHKVPGFDPMKHLHSAVNDKGEPVMRLEPRYQRLWFRLACPNGRMLLTPLHVTHQLAIFEAKVFFHRDDATPASSFTSSKTAQETSSYIRAAQDEAMMMALDNAGFGIQLCDLTQTANDGQCHPSAQLTRADVGQEQPTRNNAQMAQPPIRETPPITTGQEEPKAARQVEPETPPAETAEASVTEQPTSQPVPADQPAPEFLQAAELPASAESIPGPAPQPTSVPDPADQPAPASVEEAAPAPVEDPVPAPVEEQGTLENDQREGSAQANGPQSDLITVLKFPSHAEKADSPKEAGSTDPASAVTEPSSSDSVTEPTAADTAPSQEETPAQTVPSYTEDMPVEEICKVMTLEEAGAIVVPSGPNKGLTMAQVAERRSSSLRFYITPFYKCSNSQKAAATLLIQNLDLKKAG